MRARLLPVDDGSALRVQVPDLTGAEVWARGDCIALCARPGYCAGADGRGLAEATGV